jgi:TrmH family RNA methyltransferase
MPTAGQLHVVLVRTRNPLNIGAAARAMSNFGFRSLRLVNPYSEAFREARSAVGAADVLKNAREFTTLADAVADCSLVVGTTALRNRKLQHPLKTPAESAPFVRKRLASQSVALLFGSEKTGLSAEDLSHCHWSLRIPTVGNISMNLGQAVAVCLYELSRDGGKRASRERIKLATSGEVDRLTGSLLRILSESGYVKPKAEESAERKLRDLLRRLQISKDDAELLQGMLRQIAWKIGGAGRNRTDA